MWGAGRTPIHSSLAAKENLFAISHFMQKRRSRCSIKGSRSHCFDFFISSCVPPLNFFSSFFFSFFSLSSILASVLALGTDSTRSQVTSGPCEGQVIQGHWWVIFSDWLTSKRTPGRSQSPLSSPSPPLLFHPPRRSLPPPFHLLQLISSLCHMTRASRQREDD